MKRNNEPKEIIDADALRLLRESGQLLPSPERVQLTRWLMEVCQDEYSYYSEPPHWDESFVPEMDSFGIIEVLMLVEEKYDVFIDEASIESAQLDTFGDTVRFLEPFVAFALSRPDRERRHIVSAPCATQAAFYAMRRSLVGTGAAYHKLHDLRPTLPLTEIPAKHVEPLAESLAKDFGLSLPLQRVVWNRVDTGAMQWAFFVASVVACFYVAPVLPLPFLTGALLCILANVAFARLVGCHARYKWPKEYRTLGDVARKIDVVSSASQAAW